MSKDVQGGLQGVDDGVDDLDVCITPHISRVAT
jgi:hypothetical protein